MASYVGSLSEQAPLLAQPRDDDDDNNDDVAPTSLSRKRMAAVVIVVACLLLVQSTNITAVTTTQSDIAADLDASSSTPWLISSYMIAFASLTPLGGRLSQIFSLRTFLAATNLIFAIGLLLTARANSVSAFITGRVLAGCGSAGIYSMQTILVLELCSKRRRGLVLGCVYTTLTIGVASGAIIAGALTPKYGWRLIYYIQSPICFVATPILYLAIPQTGTEKAANNGEEEDETNSLFSKLCRIDYLGILTLTAANVLLLYSLSSSAISYVLLATSIGIFAIFLVVESSPRLAAEPIVPVSILRSRDVMLTGIASTGLMMSRWAVLFYLPVYGIAVRGWSPAEGGMIMIPTNAGFALGGIVVGWIHIRKATSYYTSSLTIITLFTLSLLLIAFLSTPNSPIAIYTSAIFVNGFACAAFLNYSLSHLLYLTSPSSHYIVTSLLATFRSLSGSFGSAIGGGVFASVLRRKLEEGFHQTNSNSIININDHADKEGLIRNLLGRPALVWQLEGHERQVAIAAYQGALKTMFLAAVILSVVMVFVQAGTGSTPAKDDGGGNSGEHTGEEI